MPLIAHPTIADTLLSVGGTALAGSTDCCCVCDCWGPFNFDQCGILYLPWSGSVSGGTAFFADFDITLCQSTCIICTSQSAFGLGTSSAIQNTNVRMNITFSSVQVPDPSDLCVLLPDVCGQWIGCPFDISGQFRSYNSQTQCSGLSTTATSASISAELMYDHPNRRFVLAVWLTPFGLFGTKGLIFLGTHAFDASKPSACFAFPLTFTNGLGSCNCACLNPDYESYATRVYATGGTVTVRANTNCNLSGCPNLPDGGGEAAAMSPRQLRGDVDGAASLIARADASRGSSLAPGKKGCCV